MDIFTNGKFDSRFFEELEEWFVKRFAWQPEHGPVGADIALSGDLEVIKRKLSLNLNRVNKQYRYKIEPFSVKGHYYILLANQLDRENEYYVFEAKDLRKKQYQFVCDYKTSSPNEAILYAHELLS